MNQKESKWTIDLPICIQKKNNINESVKYKWDDHSYLMGDCCCHIFVIITIVADWYKEKRKKYIEEWSNCEDLYKMYMLFDISHGQCS